MIIASHAASIQGSVEGGSAGSDLTLTITIPSTSVLSTLSGFPVRLNLDLLPASFWNSVSTDGGSIRITDSSDNPIAFDLVWIDTLTEAGELFFKAPSISHTANTLFKLTLTSGLNLLPVTDAFGRNAVWSDYDVVYVFNSMSDRTGNGRDAITFGTLASGTPNWLNLDGNGNVRSPGFTPIRTQWTMGASVVLSALGGNKSIISMSPATGLDPYRATLAYRNTGTNFGAWNSTDTWLMSSGSVPAINTRYRLHHTFNGTVNRKIYRNGVLEGTDTGTSQRPLSFSGINPSLYVGAEDGDVNERLNGRINYVYFRNGELSSDWLAAEQKSWETNTFLSVMG